MNSVNARWWVALAWLAVWVPLVGSAQTRLTKDLKKDFGAVGDGKTNDQLLSSEPPIFLISAPKHRLALRRPC
jgi:hypothetical protein